MSQPTIQRVVDCLVTTTRYPRELLTPDAELESGLGIDSVKRMELLLAMGEEFNLDLQSQAFSPAIKSIGDVANWIDGLLDDAKGESGQAIAPAQEPKQLEPEPLVPEQLEPTSHGNGVHRDASAENVHVPHSVRAPHYQANSQPPQPSRQGKPLEGRVALVTGSGRGVGRVIARLLAERGATVLVNSFHSRELGEQTAADINASGGKAVHIWGSVANPAHVDEMFNEVERYGLDILICNASDGRIGNFTELTPDDWDRAFRTNVSGHYQCAMRAADIMRPRGGGSIVTMSAVGAHQHIAGLGSQGVVKAAVESLTRYLAFSLSGSGVRVNCVAGGPIYGELLDKFPSPQAAQSHWESMTPDGELCTPMDLATTIGFLVSDDARAINGAVWMVDHGFSATAEGQRQRQRQHTTTV